MSEAESQSSIQTGPPQCFSITPINPSNPSLFIVSESNNARRILTTADLGGRVTTLSAGLLLVMEGATTATSAERVSLGMAVGMQRKQLDYCSWHFLI